MNNAKHEFFPFVRLVYYIRGFIGIAMALVGAISLASGEQKIYEYVLSLVATVLTFLIARFFTEGDFASKISLLFGLFALKEAAALVADVIFQKKEHLLSSAILCAVALIFYIAMAIICRFSLKGYALAFMIYISVFCLSLTPVISLYNITAEAVEKTEPELLTACISFLGTALATAFNFLTVYVCATRKNVSVGQ